MNKDKDDKNRSKLRVTLNNLEGNTFHTNDMEAAIDKGKKLHSFFVADSDRQKSVGLYLDL